MPSGPTNPPDLAAFLAAVVTILRADAGVAALVGARVYSHAPEQETLPMVTVTMAAVEWCDKTASGWDVSVSIVAQSDSSGAKQALAIADACAKALHRYTGAWSLGAEGGAVVLLHAQGVTVAPSADLLGFNATASFQALINQD
jgi:hypothetical protein